MAPVALKSMLLQLHFSAEMPVQVLNSLSELGAIEHVSAEQVLFREGSENRNWYLIHCGRVALEMNVPGRGTVRILTLGPGEMVAWSALVGHCKMTATAVAIDDSQLIAFPAESIEGLCDTNLTFGFHLMQQLAKSLSKRLLATRLQLLDLFAEAPPAVPARHIP